MKNPSASRLVRAGLVALAFLSLPVCAFDLQAHRGGQWLTASGPLIKTLTLAQLQAYDVGRLNPMHPYAKEFPDPSA